MASKNKIAAQEFVDKCKELGWTFKAKSSVISIYKTIPINSNSEFSKAENESGSLLDIVKMTKNGSVWGTDGASIGGHYAMTSGNFSMNKSGCSAHILNAINKIIL